VPGITNSEGGDAGFSRSEAMLVTSAGFVGRTSRSGHSISCSAVAGTGTDMQRDYDYHSTIHLSDLDDPALIGRRAAEKAVARLNPRRPATARIPVVYDPRVAGGLVRSTAARSRAARPS
jgi:PmbA protein